MIDVPAKRAAPRAVAVLVPPTAAPAPAVAANRFDRAFAAFERVLPNPLQMGIAMLLFLTLLAWTGDFGADDDLLATQQAAAQAAAAAPGYVPF